MQLSFSIYLPTVIESDLVCAIGYGICLVNLRFNLKCTSED